MSDKNKKNFNINSSIHNAIYHLLGNEEDYIGIRVRPTNFFGVDGISDDGIRYVLNTAKGKIDKREFTDQLLFTHRGFSGPLALNLSLFVNENTKIKFNFIPEINVLELLQKEKNNKQNIKQHEQLWKTKNFKN